MRPLEESEQSWWGELNDEAQEMGLHPSHQWGHSLDLDCVIGNHGSLYCLDCDLYISNECWVELLRRKHPQVPLAALQPCIGSPLDRLLRHMDSDCGGTERCNLCSCNAANEDD